MKIKYFTLILFLIFKLLYSQNCPEKINILPMYGGVKKCKEQIESDKEFLAEMDQLFPNRQKAMEDRVKSGWKYFYENDLDTAMKRFNQAWLLSPQSYEIYWGFGNITAMKGNPKKAVKYFDTAKKLNPSNSDFYVSSALAYSQIFLTEKNSNFLKIAIRDLETGLKLNPKNGKLYSMLSTSYFYLNNIKEAKKYLKEAEKLEPSSINPEFKKILENK
ncbi:hypothetical protein IX39_04515 [Chryseobacterium formosense]|uniref:Uncharacterized protein n=1 Tax=Chryseobacterium formosense TaxID=236814 RepID=A0A085Z655_9FLAO|nr:tetratricopeptide repeat protein [Chryseobacterium formosense]KFE99918.1 hypothetical protein IX39_04515 [Chryseobacterium formosense]